VVITGGGEAAEAETLAAMQARVPLILNARLRDDGGRRVGKPDRLEQKGQKLKHGEHAGPERTDMQDDNRSQRNRHEADL
jgi:hypothetical protein